MSGVISAIVVLLIIGAVAALILVIASKYMSVPENEMFPAIRECLPGANCGACGYAGCDGYAKALADKRREGGNAPVLESQFRYSGRPPQDREMAIISLADACEAASRSLDKPSAAKIEAVVNGIFQKRFEDGQLNQANITLAELEKVRQSFINTLISMKHGRIAYQREQREEDEEPAVLVGDQAVPPAESK